MSERPAVGDQTAARWRAARQLRHHLAGYAGVIAGLFAINWATGGPWWFVWPAFGWGIVVAAHWFYVRSIAIDDAWADERTEDIRDKAYDAAHIDNIKGRYAGARPRVRSGALTSDSKPDRR